MVMLVWTLDLQLSMQSVPINTKVVSLNPAHVIKFVSDLWQVSGLKTGFLRLPPRRGLDGHWKPNISLIIYKLALQNNQKNF